MATVENYSVGFFGSKEGRAGVRARISLHNNQKLLGWIDFVDEGKAVPLDHKDDAQALVFMNLPAGMFENVLDTLRNEKPIDYTFSGSTAILGTSKEIVGEAE